MAVLNSRFLSESTKVSKMVDANNLDAALASHIQVEHETSHELEDQLNGFIAQSDLLATDTEKAFKATRQLLTVAVGAFSLTSLTWR